jgi:hypothetical protein
LRSALKQIFPEELSTLLVPFQDDFDITG